MTTTPFTISPLKLESYFITELSYAVKSEFEGRVGQSIASEFPSLHARVDASRSDDDPLRWRCALRVESDDQASTNFPYSIRVALVGYFAVSADYQSESAEALARVNGTSILYSAAREALAAATGRSGFAAIVLPSVRFLPTNPAPALEARADGARSGEGQTSDKPARTRAKRKPAKDATNEG